MEQRLKIFIDAGHNDTGFNGGAEANGMREQDITFEVSKLLFDILKKDFDIMLSRPTKETNLGTDNASAVNARWQMSNSWGADFFISIHVNAGGGTGAETFYSKDIAKDYATTIQDTYSSKMGLRNRRTEKTNNFAVLNFTTAPAILLELAFIDSPLSNPDVNILVSKREDMANAIAKGFYKYLEVFPRY
jgi:N-acetylmuramoyl-L-alanine amidase